MLNYQKKGSYLSFLILIIIIFLSGCSQYLNSPTPQAKNTVKMINNTFDPKTIIVSVGTEITWINEDSTSHSVTCWIPYEEGGGLFFDSGNIKPEQTYKRTFTVPGEFPYHCKKLHYPEGEMAGTVIVQ